MMQPFNQMQLKSTKKKICLFSLQQTVEIRNSVKYWPLRRQLEKIAKTILVQGIGT
jgi:hypothetical protein